MSLIEAIPNVVDKCFALSSVNLSIAKSTVGAVNRVGLRVVGTALLAAYLTADVIWNIRKWFHGEISGERCVKNIVDTGFSLAGGAVAGTLVGSYAGAAFGPPGVFIGGFVGGILGTTATNYVVDRLTQWFFGLPKDVALENAYRLLQVPCQASNDVINKSFKKLCLKHHPDKGGNREDWEKLQLSMQIIRLARGEA